MFDVFRQDHVDSGSESWASLSAAAQDAHERLTRVYRSKCRLPPQPRRASALAAQGRGLTPGDILAAALDSPLITQYQCHRNNEGLIREEYAALLGDPALGDAASIHALVRTAPLPGNVRRAQEKALDLISQRCQRQARVRRTKHVCLLCERRGHRGKPRLCSKTFRVVCQSCNDNASSIPAIDMVGRIVTVLGRQFVLAPCCATVQEYAGTGRDLMPGPCSHATHAAHPSKHPVAASRKPRVACGVCDAQALPRPHVVLDHIAARMSTVHLCHRHTPPEEWIRRCANLRQFEVGCREWDAKVKTMHRRG
jgi:hypothetical protein